MHANEYSKTMGGPRGGVTGGGPEGAATEPPRGKCAERAAWQDAPQGTTPRTGLRCALARRPPCLGAPTTASASRRQKARPGGVVDHESV